MFLSISCDIWLLQELNAKAEAKFKKLRAQAKNKIADLNREMQRLKEGRSAGDDSLTTSSLNISVSSDVSSNLLHALTVY